MTILLYSFSPFWLGSSFTFQNQAGAMLVLATLATLGCIALLLRCGYTSTHRTALASFSILDVLLSAFLGYVLLQSLFYPADSGHVIRWMTLALMYILFRQLPSSWTIRLLFLVPVMAVFQTVYGYFQLAYPWQGLSDITGGFGNTGIFGGFVALGWATALGLLFMHGNRCAAEKTSRWLVVFLLLLLIPLSIQLVYSQSRAAWLAAITGAAVLLVSPVFRRLKRRNALMVTAFLLIAFALLLVPLYHYKKDSADGRMLIWTVSTKMMADKPLTGFGTDGFQRHYLHYQADYFKNNPQSRYAYLADNAVSPFNEWLGVGVERGIVGLLPVLGMLFFAFRYSWGSPPLRAVISALVVFAGFSYPFSFVAFKVLAVFCLASVPSPVVVGMQPMLAGARVLPQWLRRQFVLYCFVGVMGGAIVYSSFVHYNAVKEWNSAFHARSVSEQTQRMEVLYPVFQRNALFVTVYGTILHRAQQHQQALPVLERAVALFPSAQSFILLGELYEHTGNYSAALAAWETASYIRPVLFAPLYNRALLYHRLGYHQQAREIAEEVVNKRVKIRSPVIERMRTEMRKLIDN